MQVEEILREHKIEFRRIGEHHHVSHGWINLDCPNCSPRSSRFRLGWNLHGGYFSCWACGKKDTYSTWMEVLKLPFGQVRDLFKDVAKEKYKHKPQPSGTLKIPTGIGRLKIAHRNYLIQRGFKSTLDLEKTWMVQGIGYDNVNLKWRIFIPICADGEIVSWTTRSIVDTVQRYISASTTQEKFSHKLLLYGEEYCKNTIIVCEGPLDVWRIGPGAVCTFGLRYSRAQVLKMSKYANRYVCFDSDNKSQVIARKLCDDLSVFPGETYNIELETEKDAGSASDCTIEMLRSLLV